MNDEEAARTLPHAMKTGQDDRARAAKIHSSACSRLRWTAWAAASAPTSAPASRTKALVMKPLDSQLEQQECFDYAVEACHRKADRQFSTDTVKGSQFKQPLLEFSGACAGCARDPLRQADHPAVRRPDVSSPTPPAVPPSGAARAPATPYTVNKRAATALPGPTPCLRTTPSTACGIALGQKTIARETGRQGAEELMDSDYRR